MNARLTSILMLSALTLAAAVLAPRDAAAEVRVGLTVRTPGLHLRVGDVAHPRVRVVARPAPRAVRVVRADVDRHDRRVARRLARYMGVRTNDLLRLRRHGLSWRQIAREYGLSARVARAAAHERSWNAFLNGRKPAGWCGTRVH